MATLPKLLSPRRIAAFLGIAVFLFGLAMLHPYPRQSLFGPTIRGKPRCYWEGEIRRFALQEKSLVEKTLEHVGFKQDRPVQRDLFDHAEMAPLIIDMLEDPDGILRVTLLEQIIQSRALHVRSVLPALHQQLESDDGETRILAAWAIWTIDRDKAALPVLTKGLADPFYRALTMAYAVRAAEEAPELYPHIAAHAKDQENAVRVAVMQALAHFGKKGVPTLIDGLRDNHFEVRLEAAQSLVNLGADAKDAEPALAACLRDPDRDVRMFAREALQNIDPERYKNLKEVK